VGSLEELAMAETCETASHLMAVAWEAKRMTEMAMMAVVMLSDRQ